MLLGNERLHYISEDVWYTLLAQWSTVRIVQVSLAIRGGYVPGKITIREYQNPHFSLKIN